MTRIVAGAARGRRLRVPARGTRPTADRVREAVFNALATRIELDGARVLDLYAGSGAMGLEAVSRGAAYALLVESDARAAVILAENARAVGLPGAVVRRASVASLLRGGCAEPFDLVCADPPYAVGDATVRAVLARLADDGWLAPSCLVVVERSARGADVDWPPGLVPEWGRRYGEARVEMACYRRAP